MTEYGQNHERIHIICHSNKDELAALEWNNFNRSCRSSSSSKKIFVDLDNTICRTSEGNYTLSTPIQERINFFNDLYNKGNHITIWTARGSSSGIDHIALTLDQLKEWGVLYHELKMGKPSYDEYYDDKSFNIDTAVPIVVDGTRTKKEPCVFVPKGWGEEIIFANTEEYCGKILRFNAGKKFSLHFHVIKNETWYVAKGKFILIWIDITNGTKYTEYLSVGDVITNKRGEPHQLIALEDSDIFEVSTKHYDTDSYRIYKGD